MRKLPYRLLILLILVFLLVQPMAVMASESVDTSQDCTLTLEYSSNGSAFSDLDISVYRIAEIYPNGEYALIAPFDTLPVKIHSISSQKEWRDTANTLAAYIASQQIPATQTVTTTAEGISRFSQLETGLYLVLGVSIETTTHTYQFENFCTFLPRPQPNGTQVYDVVAKPKYSLSEKPDKPVDITWQVMKLWKDAGIQSARPDQITVDILKNQVLQETVVLNEKNNWTYSWTAPDGEDTWHVVEKDVPEAYSVVITKSGTVFSITNSRPAPGGNPPKTGDTFALRPFLILLSMSGMMLMILGILKKRNTR